MYVGKPLHREFGATEKVRGKRLVEEGLLKERN